jgi:hypothetical protein
MKYILENKEIELTEEELEEIIAQKNAVLEPAKATWGHIPCEYNKDETMVLDGVKYHRHVNGGGWVSEKAQVDDTAWVGFFAMVKNGVVKDQAIIHDTAIVNCDGLQSGAKGNVSGSARVYGSAHIWDSACVYDSANVYGSAHIWDSACVYGSAHVSGSARVYGSGYLKKSTSESIALKDGEIVE